MLQTLFQQQDIHLVAEGIAFRRSMGIGLLQITQIPNPGLPTLLSTSLGQDKAERLQIQVCH